MRYPGVHSPCSSLASKAEGGGPKEPCKPQCIHLASLFLCHKLQAGRLRTLREQVKQWRRGGSAHLLVQLPLMVDRVVITARNNLTPDFICLSQVSAHSIKKFEFPPQPSHLLATLWQVPRWLDLSVEKSKKERQKKSSSLISKLLRVTEALRERGAEVTLRSAATTSPPALWEPRLALWTDAGICWLSLQTEAKISNMTKEREKQNGKKKFNKRRSKLGRNV